MLGGGEKVYREPVYLRFFRTKSFSLLQHQTLACPPPPLMLPQVPFSALSALKVCTAFLEGSMGAE